MKTLQRHIIFVLLMIAASCAESDYGSDQLGYLSISGIECDLSVNEVLSKAEAISYTVEIYNSSGELHSSYSSDDIPEQITLSAGSYSVVAYTGVASGAQFDTPIYSGSSSVTIEPGETAPASIVCTLSTIKVGVTFSEDMATAGFSSYYAVVRSSAGDALVFDETTEGMYGYVVDDGLLSCTIYVSSVTNGVEETYSQVKYYDNLEPNDFLNIIYSVESKEDLTGANGYISINVDETINEVSQSYLLLLDNGAPTISGVDFDVDEVLSLRGGNVTTLEFSITSASQIDEVIINHNEVDLIAIGLPKYINFATMDAATSSAVSDIGISCSGLGSESVTLTLSAITSQLPIVDGYIGSIGIEAVGTKATSYKRFEYTVVDAVLRTTAASASSSYVWNSEGYGRTSATLNGLWQSTDKPDALMFRYRESSETVWQDITEESLTIDESSKSVSVTLSECLKLGRTYVYKLVNDEEDGGEITFTTVAGPTVSNMNFDSWYVSEGGTFTSDCWYPAANSSSLYWATGNPGITGFGSNKSSNSTPEYSKVISGTAAKLYTRTDITIVTVAAGNLFTGTYESDLSDYRNSVDFGRSYTGRPSRMTGYYDYTPGTIDACYSSDNVSSSLYSTYKNTTDKCHIYIQLESSSGTVIGYGEMKDDSTTGEYKQFSIEVEYYSTEVPTVITIVATSSYLGGDFVGGSGSTLYVDEFEFEFD